MGYDMVRVAAAALRKVDGDRPDPAKLREALEGTQYEGAMGLLRYSAKVHEPDAASILFIKVEQGKFVRAQK